VREFELTRGDIVGEPGENDLVECVWGTSGKTGEQVGSVRCKCQWGVLVTTSREHTMSNSDDLAESRNAVADTSVSKHLSNGGRLSNLVRDLNDLSAIWVG
jgi:hypothetical protein